MPHLNDKFKTTIHTPVVQYIVLSGGKNVSIRERKNVLLCFI